MTDTHTDRYIGRHKKTYIYNTYTYTRFIIDFLWIMWMALCLPNIYFPEKILSIKSGKCKDTNVYII